MDFTLDPGLAIIWGVLIGIFTTFFAFLLSEKVKQWLLRKSVASALLAEATAAREQHMEVIGKHIEATVEGSLPQQRFVWDGEAFPIFKQLSGNLGLFSKDEAGQLARSYSQALGFVASLKAFMNKMNRLDDLTIQIAATDQAGHGNAKAAFQTERGILEKWQIDFFKYIKERHTQVTGPVYSTIKSILEKHAK